MADTRGVVVLSGVRTAIGDYGGSLKAFSNDLGAQWWLREAIKRAKVDPGQIGQGVIGNVIPRQRTCMFPASLRHRRYVA